MRSSHCIRYFSVLIAVVLLCAKVSAHTYASLTVISTTGYKFHLYLDGQQINKQAESAIRVRILPDRHYTCTVDFTDKTQDDITRKHLLVTDPDNHNAPLDVVYKTQEEAHGKKSLVLVAQKLASDTSRLSIPAGTISYDYTPDSAQVTGVYGTLHIDTVYFAAPSFAAPVVDTIPIEHTLKSTIIRSDSICSKPMPNSDYQAARAAMNTTSFDDVKLKSAKAMAAANCLTAKQIIGLCLLLDFDQAKLELARYAYPYCYDRQNYKSVVAILQDDPHRAVLNAMIIKDYPVPVTIYH